MRKRLDPVSRFVQGHLMEMGQGHKDEPWGPQYRWEHTLRVARWAWVLANEEAADVEKNVMAALFHDVSHFVSKDYRKHGKESAEIAVDFMRKAGFPDNVVKDVAYAVASHVSERNPTTVEARTLQDADTLDWFGLFRLLLFGKTANLANLEQLRAETQSFIEYLGKAEDGVFGPVWTKTGREKVAEFVNLNRAVYSEILSEIENTKPPDSYI